MSAVTSAVTAAGPVAVITGASSGIGEGLAKALAAKPTATGPYRLLLVARREAELQRVVAEVNDLSGSTVAAYYVADASKEQEVNAAADFAVKTFGRIDVWVNNAGRGQLKRASELTEADIDDMMRVNVYSALHGSKAALRVFKAQTPAQGTILNVSSVVGRQATIWPDGAAYAASKHFLNGLTDSLRAELQANEATKDIVVTLYSPGPVATDAMAHAGIDVDIKTAFPGAQSVEEVGAHMRSVIEEQREDVYSRDQYKSSILEYLTAKN